MLWGNEGLLSITVVLMNASPYSASSSLPAAGASRARKAAGKWTYSIAAVFFLFGGLMAVQLRNIQQVNANHARNQEGEERAKILAAEMKGEVEAARARQETLQRDLLRLQDSINRGKTLNAKQIQSLNNRIRDLQAVAGVTAVSGPGVRVVLNDNPNASQGATGPFVPGIVHDFDVLQVVNELRAAKADAISVNGTRVTGYTPIRCVGPTILVNWEPVAAPFVIDAIGDTKTLQSALSMPNGIVDNLRGNGAIQVKINTMKALSMEGSTSPSFKVAKAAG